MSIRVKMMMVIIIIIINNNNTVLGASYRVSMLLQGSNLIIYTILHVCNY